MKRMKRLMLNTILACVALAAGVIGASAQTGEAVKIKFSDKQMMEGVLVNGRPYVALSELSRAISGKVDLARGLKIDGDTISVTEPSGGVGGTAGGLGGGDVGGCGAKCLFTFKSAGVISSKLVRVKGKDGVERILVPLDDLAKAMGRTARSDATNRMFNVMGPDPYGDICKKCLLKLNPQATTVNPQATRP